MNGVDPNIFRHIIPTSEAAKTRKFCPYAYNNTFAQNIKEEIDKFKEVEFIYEIEHTKCVSLITVVL